MDLTNPLDYNWPFVYLQSFAFAVILFGGCWFAVSISIALLLLIFFAAYCIRGTVIDIFFHRIFAVDYICMPLKLDRKSSHTNARTCMSIAQSQANFTQNAATLILSVRNAVTMHKRPAFHISSHGHGTSDATFLISKCSNCTGSSARK